MKLKIDIWFFLLILPFALVLWTCALWFTVSTFRALF
jgi:hypothetical protein